MLGGTHVEHADRRDEVQGGLGLAVFSVTHEPSLQLQDVLHKSIYFAQPSSRNMEGEEDMDIDPAIAAAMGFASFGTKPGDKRKYNSKDGYVDPAISSQVSNTRISSSHADKAAKAPIDPTTMSESFIGPSSAVVPKRPAEATL
jgi:hypothetical protein